MILIKRGIFLFLITIICHGLMLLNKGFFWDDWVFSNQSFDVLKDFYIKSTSTGGHPFATYLHSTLFNLSNSIPLSIGTIYHTITFIIVFINSILLLLIFKSFKINNSISLIYASLYIVSPLNFAKIFIVILPYTIGVFFMLLSIINYIKYLSLSKFTLWYKLLFIIFSFISFQLLNSTIVFLPVVLFVICIKLKTLKASAAIEIILITLSFWVFKIKYFSPIDEWSKYNQVSFISLVKSPIYFFKSFLLSIINIFNYSFDVFNYSVVGLIIQFLLILITFFIFYKFRFFNNNKEILQKPNIRINLGFILLLIYFACFPYNVVGHIITFDFPTSRDQILIIFGINFLIIYLIHILSNYIIVDNFKSHFLNISYSVVISLFITTNIINNIDALRVNYIQQSLKVEFKNNNIYLNKHEFVFYNNYNSTFWNESTRFYTFSGLMNEVNNNQNNLILTPSEYNDSLIITNSQHFFNNTYKLKGINLSNLNEKFRIISYYTKNKFSDLDVLKMLYLEYFDHNNYIIQNKLLLKFIYIKI